MTNSEIAHTPENKSNYFVRLFRGEIRLVITYWVFGFFVGIALRLANVAVEKNYASIATNENLTLALQVFFWSWVAYSIFILIAIWRSSEKYTGPKVWSALAKVAVILGALGTLANVGTAFQSETSTYAMQEEIRILNNSLPVMIDEATQLSNVSLNDKDITYNYKIVTAAKSDMDVQRFSDQMIPQLQTNFCQAEETRSLLNEGFTIHAAYRDMHNKPIIKVTTMPSDCM